VDADGMTPDPPKDEPPHRASGAASADIGAEAGSGACSEANPCARTTGVSASRSAPHPFVESGPCDIK
jgi:hypothetical protein